MPPSFFEHPILNSPYEYPSQHWDLDPQGQPTEKTIENRRPAEFITPIPKPRKRKKSTEQLDLVMDEGHGLSTQEQQYDPKSVITKLRAEVDKWRNRPNPGDWQVTPETARLLQHWRHHRFNDIRPCFCQIEAVETAIWLTEVAPNAGKIGRDFLEHLKNANAEANPELMRQAYFLGERSVQIVEDHAEGGDQPGSLETLHSDTSRPFDKPQSGRIAVKVINHLGDEVMKVFKV